MQIRIPGDATVDVNEVLMLGRDRVLLRQIRDEAATLGLMVRLENDKRKDAWARLHADEAGDEVVEEKVAAGRSLVGGLFDDLED